MIEDSARHTTVDLMNYIAASPTSVHAVAAAAERLGAAGFKRIREEDRWDLKEGDTFYIVRRDTALIAGQMGIQPPWEAGFRIVGAHTDSPGFRLKVNAETETAGYQQLGVEVPWVERW